MELTNKEFAQNLRRLAERYEEKEDLKKPIMLFCVYDKESLVELIRGFGGRWNKSVDNFVETIQFSNEDFRPLYITIPRDKVCKKIVTWECQPLLSPEEEKEILQIQEEE